MEDSIRRLIGDMNAAYLEKLTDAYQKIAELNRNLVTFQNAVLAREECLRATIDEQSIRLNQLTEEQDSHLKARNIREDLGLVTENEEQRAQIAERDRHIAAMLNSSSWRMTSGFRVAKNIARAIRRKARMPRPSMPQPSDTPLPYLSSIHAEDIRRFDAVFYSKFYDDIERSGVDPAVHYREYGWAEKRLGRMPEVRIHENAELLNRDRAFVLVVCHEATRTGAPILGWNIAKELSGRYNVVTLLMNDGEIQDHFHRTCAVTAGPLELRERDPRVINLITQQLCTKYQFKFAIANSIVTRGVLRPLAENDVPSVLLIHEFYKFHCSRDELITALAWAGRVIFSADVVRRSAINEKTQFAVDGSLIVAQGKSVIPVKQIEAKRNDVEREAFVAQIFPQEQTAKKPFIVFGAGTIEYRKGVDLFVATAAEIHRIAPDSDIRMIWVGKKLDFEPYRQYGEFVDEQIVTSCLGDRLQLLDETPYIEALYALADLCFISSRLDPLPNVAIDAMIAGTPVISFKDATGVSEVLSTDIQTEGCVLPFLGVEAAARKIIELSQSGEHLKNLAERTKEIAADVFDMTRYVERLEVIVGTVETSDLQRHKDTERLISGSDFIDDFFQWPGESLSRGEAIEAFVKRAQNRIFTRKPAPGFNPESYARNNRLSMQDKNPFVHFLDAGKPPGPWQERIIYVADEPALMSNSLRIAVHIHAFYLDMVPGMLRRLAASGIIFDLLVSVVSQEAARELQGILKHHGYRAHAIRVVPNKGRDIGPMFTEFKHELQTYDVIGHFHTKKSPHVVSDARLVRDWVEFLMENLLGGKCKAARSIVDAFAADETLGLVFADDPNLIGWDSNRPFAERFATRLNITLMEDACFAFPVGTMFWARPSALKILFDANLQWDDYPAEPLPIDGTLLHAMERLLPSVVERMGYSRMVTYSPDVRR